MDLLVDVPEDLAEFVFDTRDAIPLTELADSFRALDTLLARNSRSGARLAIAEIRKGSIVALLAPFVPIMGQSVSFMASAIEISDFVKRLRDGMNAFAGIEQPYSSAEPTPVDTQVAVEIAALVKPLAGRAGGRLDMAHIKYHSRTKERVVEVEASYGPAEIDRIAVNAARAGEMLPLPTTDEDSDAQVALHRKVVLTLQQANTGPAKEKGKTGDRGIIQAVSSKPLAVYFAKTLDDLKQKMVGRSSNPFRQPFKVEVLVSYEDDEPKSYTVIDVHGAYRQRKKKGPLDLLSGLA
ncbi:MAG: hypothetical protein PGN08_02460 [Sphingomonas taxi]